MNISVKNYHYTLTDEGTIDEGDIVYLDIAEGTIQLKSAGYIQGTNQLKEHKGRYIITGESTQNTIKVMEQGIYNITLKDLDIKTSNCPFNANANRFSTGCNVNITLEGENSLVGTNSSGLGFAALDTGTNVNGVKIDSTITIDGTGNLYSEGSNYHAGIGVGYIEPCGVAGNIVINGGNVMARSYANAATIGSGLGCDASDIIINDGIINLKNDNNSECGAIGSQRLRKVENIIINGGKIYLDGWGRIGTYVSSSGSIQIKGGYIKSPCAIGGNFNKVLISGGVFDLNNIWGPTILCDYGGSIEITGGNISAKGPSFGIGTFNSQGSQISYTPTDGTNDLYETKIKLQNVGENKKVTKLTTSDNINYGINDMNTLEDGMLYLYLPKTTEARTITIECDGKTYTGAVQTTETPEVVTLTTSN